MKTISLKHERQPYIYLVNGFHGDTGRLSRAIRGYFSGDEHKVAIWHRALRVFHSAKSRAKKYGADFNLTLAWLFPRVSAGICEATGLKFENTKDRGPSIDRVNNKYGYTRENCWLVCWQYNRAKGEGGVWAVQEMAAAIMENNHDCIEAHCRLIPVADHLASRPLRRRDE